MQHCARMVARSVAMKLTGHRTDCVYRGYAVEAEVDLAEGVAKRAGLHQPNGGRRRGTQVCCTRLPSSVRCERFAQGSALRVCYVSKLSSGTREQRVHRLEFTLLRNSDRARPSTSCSRSLLRRVPTADRTWCNSAGDVVRAEEAG
jgi:hypothetical protein